MTLSVSSTPKTLASPASKPDIHCPIDAEDFHEAYTHFDRAFNEWHVAASGRHGQGYYQLHWTPRGWLCTCPGARYHTHKKCSHVRKVDELEAQGKLYDLPEATWLRYEQERWQRLDAELSASCGQV